MPASERSLSFTGPMAQAILEGRKTQTRRILKPSKVFVDGRVVRQNSDAWGRLDWSMVRRHVAHVLHVAHVSAEIGAVSALTPRVIPGTRVMVKEPVTILPGGPVLYHGQQRPLGAPPHPRAPRFMPYSAARMWLHIEAVRFERLQNITRGDAMAEGCPFANVADGFDPRDWFSIQWTAINGAAPWASNPWVLAITFKLAEVRHAA